MDMSTAFANLNWLAIFAAALSRFAIGGLWYSALFSKAWMAENGFTEESMKANPGNLGLIFGTTFLLSVIMSLNLAMFLGGQADVTFGIIAGALVSIGWVAPSIGTYYLFERRTFKLFMINAGYAVISFIVMGAILGAWR